MDELEKKIEKYRDELREQLGKKLVHSDRLVIAMSKQFNDIKNIKSSDLVLFKSDTENLTLGDLLIEYKALLKVVAFLVESFNDIVSKMNTEQTNKYDTLAKQFMNLLDWQETMAKSVEILKQEVF